MIKTTFISLLIVSCALFVSSAYANPSTNPSIVNSIETETQKQDPLPSSMDAFDLLTKKEQQEQQKLQTAINNQVNKQATWQGSLPLILASLAVLLAFIGVLISALSVKKVTKPKSVFNQVNDHWYRSVIHPQCYLPLLTLLQAFEKQLLKAKSQGVNQEQGVKLFWQLQDQKTAITNTMKMVISPQLVATAMVDQLDAIFAQMETECMDELQSANQELEAQQTELKSVSSAVQKISQRFKVLHQQMIDSAETF